MYITSIQYKNKRCNDHILKMIYMASRIPMSVHDARIIMIRIDSRMIIAKNGLLFIRTLKLKKDSLHAFYHKCLRNNVKKHPILHDILKRKTLVFNLEGSKKLNLLLYLLLKNEDIEDEMIMVTNNNISAIQREVYSYLILDAIYIEKLRKEYPRTFSELINSIKNCTDDRLLILAKHLNYIYKFYRKPLFFLKFYNLHLAFCSRNTTNHILNFSKDYKKMVESINNNDYDIEFRKRLFYPELGLITDFYLSQTFELIIPEGLPINHQLFTTSIEKKVLKIIETKLKHLGT